MVHFSFKLHEPRAVYGDVEAEKDDQIYIEAISGYHIIICCKRLIVKVVDKLDGKAV